MIICTILTLALLMSPSTSEGLRASPVQDGVIFTEDFETDLSHWFGESGGGHNGLILPDPLDPNNHVLSFSALKYFGDIFSQEFYSGRLLVFGLFFDYLGYPKAGTPEGNTGGRIGITNVLQWLAATTGEPELLELIDDGQWHTYSIGFFAGYDPVTEVGTFRVMIQDWCGQPPAYPQGVPGDAFFDNIKIYQGHVPVESRSWGAIKEMYR